MRRVFLEQENYLAASACKHGGYFGHVNFVDHDTSGFFAGLHVSSTPPDEITACGSDDSGLGF